MLECQVCIQLIKKQKATSDFEQRNPVNELIWKCEEGLRSEECK